MKKELVKTEYYLLVVDDSEIKVGDWFLTDDKRIEQSAPDWNPREWHKKIIAHLPLNNSPILEGVPLLPSIEEESYIVPKPKETDDCTSDKEVRIWQRGWIYGYTTAKEKYKFTEEDMRIMFHCGRLYQGREWDTTFEEKLKAISQPKTPTHFEFEVEKGFVSEFGEFSLSMQSTKSQRVDKIKTTTNSQGQQVACGKYIFEL